MQIPHIQFSPKTHKNIGIEIIELSDIYQRANSNKINFVGKPHRIKFHTILYITQGQGTHFIDFNTYTIQTGSVVFIQKNQINAFDLKNQPQGKLIIFTDEFLDTIHATMKTPAFAPNHLLTAYSSAVSLSESMKDTCDALILEIEKEHQLSEPNLSFLHLLFSAVLNKLTAAYPSAYAQCLSETHTEFFSQFMELLEANYTEIRDAKVYADLLNMTYKSLNNICKLATNKTVKQLIDAYTILEAKRKLSIDNIRIQKLADELGFDEATNFVKYFKKNTLLTPSQFKKSLES